MTQWKLVPVIPTTAMIAKACEYRCETMNAPSDGIYAAMLSAAPSPDGEEVERVKSAIEKTAYIHVTVRDYGLSEDSEIWNLDEVARAAIAAMRPVPKLTEEERIGLALARGRLAPHKGYVEWGMEASVAAQNDREFLFSIIDKLAGEV